MHALAVHALSKTYRNGVQALKGIDLEVEQGDFFALLGPNGAGKTTLIGITTSLVTKTGGTVQVFGHDIDRELEAAKSCIGVVPQELNFNMFETPLTIVVNQAGFYGIERRIARVRAEKYLKQLQLWDKRDSMARAKWSAAAKRPPSRPSVPTKSVSQKLQMAASRSSSWPDQRLQPAKRQKTAGRPVLAPSPCRE